MMEGFDTLFTYEPMFSAWQNKNIINRICSKIKENVVKEKKLTIYDYDDVWNSIIKNARLKSKKNIWFGGFVGYDDTPRRGKQGKIVKGESPKKFEKYLKQLKKISETQDKDFIFLTAWNEWGEGAYLEPDQDNKYEYLEALKRVVDDNEYN